MSGWIPFNTLAIGAHVPEGSGIYIIGDTSNRVIYVGKSTNLRDRLERHASGRSGKSACLQEHGASNCAYELWTPSDIAEKEGYAIGWYEFPVCNDPA